MADKLSRKMRRKLESFAREQEQLANASYEDMLDAAKHYPAPRGLNIYRCDACGHSMVTIDREPGVTPFITKCPKCGGEATSFMYRVPPNLTPTHEWYRPDQKEFDSLKPASKRHCAQGGLLRRAIPAPARQESGE